MSDRPENFFERRKITAALSVFTTVGIALPAYFIANFNQFNREQNFKEWIMANGLWSKMGMKYLALWIFGSLLFALITYGVFSFISWLIQRGAREPSLEVIFRDEPPYTEDSGPSGLGLYYSNRRIGVRSSLSGKVTVKVPTVKLENGQIRSNVFLQPTDNQPDEVDADDPGYWRVVQWNTSEASIKLVHKGKESYYIGPCGQFQAVARCGELTKTQWVTTRIDGEKLYFDLSDEPDASTLGADVRLEFQAIYEDRNMPVEKGATSFDHLFFIRLRMVSKLAETNVDSVSAVLTVDSTDYTGEEISVGDYYLETQQRNVIGIEVITRPVKTDLREIERYLRPGVINDGWISFRFESVEWPDKGQKKEEHIKKHLKLTVLDGYGHRHIISAALPWQGTGEIKQKENRTVTLGRLRI